MTVGFIGVGSMGGPMCRNIIRNSGEQVIVFDLDPVAMEACTALGAEAASSVAELARDADVIFTSLPTPAIVLDVGLGDSGIGAHARPGTVWFDLTTNSPDVARRISEALTPKGVTMVDAPVTGGVARAEVGNVSLMLGGDAALLQEYAALLGSFTSKVVHMGPVGSGATTKIVNNMILISYIAAAAEGLVLGVAAGLEPARLLDLLQSGTADSAALRAQGVRAISGDWTPAMTLDLTAKDVRLALELASQLDCPVPIAEQTHQLLRTAQQLGFGKDDGTAMLRVHEVALGRTIRDAALAASAPDDVTS